MGFLELIGLEKTNDGIKLRSWIRLTIAIALMLIIIALIIWGIVALAKHATNKSKESFITYNPLDDGHQKINIKPETSYIESYINTALGLDEPQIDAEQ